MGLFYNAPEPTRGWSLINTVNSYSTPSLLTSQCVVYAAVITDMLTGSVSAYYANVICHMSVLQFKVLENLKCLSEYLQGNRYIGVIRANAKLYFKAKLFLIN